MAADIKSALERQGEKFNTQMEEIETHVARLIAPIIDTRRTAADAGTKEKVASPIQPGEKDAEAVAEPEKANEANGEQASSPQDPSSAQHALQNAYIHMALGGNSQNLDQDTDSNGRNWPLPASKSRPKDRFEAIAEGPSAAGKELLPKPSAPKVPANAPGKDSTPGSRDATLKGSLSHIYRKKHEKGDDPITSAAIDDLKVLTNSPGNSPESSPESSPAKKSGPGLKHIITSSEKEEIAALKKAAQSQYKKMPSSGPITSSHIDELEVLSESPGTSRVNSPARVPGLRKKQSTEEVVSVKAAARRQYERITASEINRLEVETESPGSTPARKFTFPAGRKSIEIAGAGVSRGTSPASVEESALRALQEIKDRGGSPNVQRERITDSGAVPANSPGGSAVKAPKASLGQGPVSVKGNITPADLLKDLEKHRAATAASNSQPGANEKVAKGPEMGVSAEQPHFPAPRSRPATPRFRNTAHLPHLPASRPRTGAQWPRRQSNRRPPSV
ncbi:hypothetical protein CDD83_5925 [Cordyceps sp. RAO-2017]|nr:hypothetical protein CDD83_5925 [Cordyceps sp. RAO-2017]